MLQPEGDFAENVKRLAEGEWSDVFGGGLVLAAKCNPLCSITYITFIITH